MTQIMMSGIVLGLSAGFAPGPLLTLVIGETLQHDIKAGIKVALSPLFTDLSIILLTLFVLSQLSGFQTVLGIISLIGGCVILYMGYESLHPKALGSDASDTKPRSLLKGILTNVLSPHPYLFWLSVGGPMMAKAKNLNVMAPFAFIFGFYLLLIGSKIFLAVLVGRSKSFLSGKVYLYIMRILALALCVLAMLLFRDGLELLEIIQ